MIIKIPFHSCAKLTVNDSDIDKVFGSMYQNVITKKKKKKNLLAEIGLLKPLWKILLKFLSVSVDRNNSIEKWS